VTPNGFSPPARGRAAAPDAALLAVLKRHRPDAFLLSHAVDGFSLALDFPVVAPRRDELWALVREMAEPVVESGGRFYPAQGQRAARRAVRRPSARASSIGCGQIKQRLGPRDRLRSALADRLLGRRSAGVSRRSQRFQTAACLFLAAGMAPGAVAAQRTRTGSCSTPRPFGRGGGEPLPISR